MSREKCRRVLIVVVVVAAVSGVLRVVMPARSASVQIVGIDGVPIANAKLQARPSYEATESDDEGRAHVRDAWEEDGRIRGSGWLLVTKHGKTWWLTYPLSPIIRLDPAEAYPRAESPSNR